VSGLSEAHRRLVDSYIDDVASPQEVAELNRLLAADVEVADYFAETAKLNALLLEGAREAVATESKEAGGAIGTRRTRLRARSPRGSSHGSQRGRSGSRRRGGGPRRRSAPGRRKQHRPLFWLVTLGVAAAAAVVLGLFLGEEERVPLPPRWKAYVSAVRGTPQVYRNGVELEFKQGLQLEPGDRVLTDKGSLLAFKYRDGSTVELNRGGQLSLGTDRHAKNLALDSGDIYVFAARQPKGHPLAVNGGLYDQVVVAGTGFEISRFDNASLLKVAAGKVLFGSAGTLGVPEGHSSRAGRDGLPSTPQSIAIAMIAPWRRNRPPVVEPIEIETGVNVATRVLLQAADPDGDNLTYALVQLPKHGKISGTAPDLAYNPETDFTGRDELIVKVSDGLADSEPVKITIEVTAPNRPPVAALEAGPRRGKAPLKVSFYAQGSRDPDGGPVTCAWDFGDGARGEGMETLHVYQKPGSYVVKLTVQDQHGAKTKRQWEVTVLDRDIVNAPSRLKWHYQKKTGRSYLSWGNNADNASGFYVERAVEAPGAKPVYKRVATLGAGAKLWRLKYGLEDKGDWFLFRVRAFSEKTGRVSEPSNRLRLGYGVKDGPGRDVNWPPPGLLDAR
jgi:PKD domain/Bacterial Ig domain/FecR protein